MAIIGGGAIGLAYAAHLGEVCDVVVVARAQTYDAWHQGTLAVSRLEDGSARSLPTRFEVTSSWDGLAADWALVCVKNPQTAAVAQQLSIGLRDSMVITVQNGIGNDDILRRYLPSERVRAGACYIASRRLSPEHIEVIHVGKTVIEGTAEEPWLISLRSAFTKAGLPLELQTNIDEVLWNKVAVAVGSSALATICRVPLAAFTRPQEVAAMWEIATEAVLECRTVMGRKGIRMREDPLRTIHDIALAAPANYSSMLQDVLAKRMTEVDAINGALVSEGDKLGIPVPVNRMLTALVHAIEETTRWRIA